MTDQFQEMDTASEDFDTDEVEESSPSLSDVVGSELSEYQSTMLSSHDISANDFESNDTKLMQAKPADQSEGLLEITDRLGLDADALQHLQDFLQRVGQGHLKEAAPIMQQVALRKEMAKFLNEVVQNQGYGTAHKLCVILKESPSAVMRALGDGLGSVLPKKPAMDRRAIDGAVDDDATQGAALKNRSIEQPPDSKVRGGANVTKPEMNSTEHPIGSRPPLKDQGSSENNEQPAGSKVRSGANGTAAAEAAAIQSASGKSSASEHPMTSRPSGAVLPGREAATGSVEHSGLSNSTLANFTKAANIAESVSGTSSAGEYPPGSRFAAAAAAAMRESVSGAGDSSALTNPGFGPGAEAGPIRAAGRPIDRAELAESMRIAVDGDSRITKLSQELNLTVEQEKLLMSAYRQLGRQLTPEGVVEFEQTIRHFCKSVRDDNPEAFNEIVRRLSKSDDRALQVLGEAINKHRPQSNVENVIVPGRPELKDIANDLALTPEQHQRLQKALTYLSSSHQPTVEAMMLHKKNIADLCESIKESNPRIFNDLVGRLSQSENPAIRSLGDQINRYRPQARLDHTSVPLDVTVPRPPAAAELPEPSYAQKLCLTDE